MAFILVRRAEHPRGLVIGDHRHRQLEIVFVLRGNGSSTMKGRRYPLRENDYLVYPAGVGHDQVNDSALVNLCVELEESGLEPLAGLWHDHGGLVRQCCERLLSEYERREVGWQDLCEGLSRELCGLVRRQAALRGEERDERARFARALAAAGADDGRLSPADLSRASGLTPRRLRALFMRRLGTTPLRYLIRLRLERAKAQLRKEGSRLVEVAEVCGFRDVYYFSRLFKKYAGATPGAWRRRQAP